MGNLHPKSKPEKTDNFKVPLLSSTSTGYGSLESSLSETTIFHPNTDEDFIMDSDENVDIETGLLQQDEEEIEEGIIKYRGIMFAFLASLCMSSGVLMVKYLNQYHFQAYAVSTWRYSWTALLASPLLYYSECFKKDQPKVQDEGEDSSLTSRESIFDPIWPPWEGNKWKTLGLLVVRGIIGASSVILRYYTLEYLSIGDTQVITYSSPICVIFLAYLFLGEKIGFVSVIITVTTTVGVIFASDPPWLAGSKEAFDHNKMIGLTLALSCLLMTSLTTVLTKKIRGVDTSVMTFVFGLVGFIIAGSLALILDQSVFPKGIYDTALLLGLGISSFVGQVAIILALKYEDAGPVSIIRSFDIICGLIYQYFCFHIIPTQNGAIGSAVVISGIVVTGLRKCLLTLPKEDRRRKLFKWLLV